MINEQINNHQWTNLKRCGSIIGIAHAQLVNVTASICCWVFFASLLWLCIPLCWLLLAVVHLDHFNVFSKILFTITSEQYWGYTIPNASIRWWAGNLHPNSWTSCFATPTKNHKFQSFRIISLRKANKSKTAALTIMNLVKQNSKKWCTDLYFVPWHLQGWSRTCHV
jgi:hypothetical protein